MDSFPALLTLAIRAVIILLAAWGAARVLRGSSAASRHAVWCAAFGGLLATAAISLYTPKILVPIASAAAETEAPGEDVVAATPHTSAVASSWAVGVWLAGAIFIAARLIFSLLSIGALAVRPALESDWYDLLQKLRRKLRIRRDVELLVSAEAPMPMTWGAFRPVVILPSSAARWTGTRLELVLAHELAHVRRWDWLTQLGAHLACAICWFLPLTWWALREFRKERERACDDAVLRTGARPTEYAEHLVQLARAMQRASWSTALAMAQESHLGNRVTAMLDPRTDRSALRLRWLFGAGVVAAALLAPLSAITFRGAEVNGIVFDASGAVVPGAEVSLTGDGMRHTLRSGPDGSFTFHSVPRGCYEFQALHPGFRRYRQKRLALAAGAAYRLEPTLQVGTIRETLLVAAH
jgi:beta-lactamase regulating signal transducer with metallopeptidase domain